MTIDPQTMSRRQLIRHTAWFGAAVGLAVVGGEVISHIAGVEAADHYALGIREVSYTRGQNALALKDQTLQ